MSNLFEFVKRESVKLFAGFLCAAAIVVAGRCVTTRVPRDERRKGEEKKECGRARYQKLRVFIFINGSA